MYSTTTTKKKKQFGNVTFQHNSTRSGKQHGTEESEKLGRKKKYALIIEKYSQENNKHYGNVRKSVTWRLDILQIS